MAFVGGGVWVVGLTQNSSAGASDFFGRDVFAFFHGYAHGQEMPASAGLLSFALGFVTATLLLHGAGIIMVRLAVLVFATVFGTSVHAQMVSDDDDSGSEIESEAM